MTTIDRILELVKESGLTAKEFAEGANIAGGSITDWKTGRSKPSVESLQKIAKYANVQIEWLTGDSEFKTYADFKKYVVYSIFENSTDDLLRIGIKQEDIDSLLEANLSMLEEKELNDRTEKTLNNIKKMQSSYSPRIYYQFVDIYSKMLYQQKDILTEKSMDTLEKEYENLRKQHGELIKASSVLIDYIEKNNLNKCYMAPVYGRISAGQPNWAEECIEGRIPIDPELMNIVDPEECFFLRVNGESMNQLIKNGAFALIRKQDTVENGEVAVVLVNGYDATLKKFSKQGDLVVLEPMSNDPSFTTQVYSKDTEIKVIGKYIGKMEMK